MSSGSILEEVTDLKEKGNTCAREQQYVEAVLHYSHALKLDPTNYPLYSNRSFAFLKIQQYYHAIEDAKKAIMLKPDWVKGYYRKAEVEFAVSLYADALLSYRLALQFQPGDLTILEAISRTIKAEQTERRADVQIPWLGAGIGIIIGVIIVIADQVTQKPTITHPLLMALLTIVISLSGYGAGWLLRFYAKCQRDKLLDPPIDLFKEHVSNEEKVMDESIAKDRISSPRYSKSQARQRYRKGKS